MDASIVIATASIAIATVTAAITGWQTWEVRKTVKGQDEDRRLSVQPYIDVYESDSEWRVENVGSGVAIECVVFTWLPGVAGVQAASEVMVIGPNHWKRWNSWALREPADHLFALYRDPHRRVDVAICRDQLGTFHRFGPASKHDICPENETIKPDWIRYLEGVGRSGARLRAPRRPPTRP